MPPKEVDITKTLDPNKFRVSVFGSARVKKGDPVWQDAYDLAKGVAGLDMDLITGGGPGIMGAASDGHRDGDVNNTSKTIGINIRLPFEQAPNPALEYVHTHDKFSTRLDEFMLLSNIVVVMPGGIGTCLELFYTWQLIQVHHVCRMPLILVGEMWRTLIEWVIDHPLKHGYLSSEDLEFIVLVDNGEEALEVIKKAKEHFDKSGHDACYNWKKYGKKF